MRQIRNVGCGLLLGVIIMLALGQAAAPKNLTGGRYQVTVTEDSRGNEMFFILDHQTDKLYRRVFLEFKHEGTPIEKILETK